ncbi:DUF29 family protein [Thermosynechococcus sp.]|uniref:DUF29 family protein n=1 Tax=Thermosynechococcus sp. TaxID=2814275 RepID=UPI00391C446D
MTLHLKSGFLYETDYYLWLHETVAHLKAQDFGNLYQLFVIFVRLTLISRSQKERKSDYPSL